MNRSFIAFVTDPGSGLYLKLDIADSRASSPFVTADDSLAFAVARKAGVAASGGTVISDVFVVMSRDEYIPYGNIAGEVTNGAIDERWQRMIRSSAGGGFGVPGPGCVDSDGTYPKFSPVFFCRKTMRYFSPVCPACSSGLDVCKDEGILKENGLASYESSLRRYLCCPECLAKGRPAIFYAPSRRDDESDIVQDRSALIRGFVNLLVRPDSDIPCASCKDRADCYGESWLALDNITGLSFYPFHAVLNEAGTMAATDFIKLLSGASFAEIEDDLRARGFSGRLNAVTSYEKSSRPASGLFFETDDRAFLEVLYLKLSFALDLMSRIVRDSGGQANSWVAPGLESVWTVLPDSLGLLPSFWNFRTVRIKGPEDDDFTDVLPYAPKGFSEYSAGRLFMYTLISSSLIGRKEIDARLKDILDAPVGGAPPGMDSIAAGIFDPENIFYNPGGRKIREEYLDVFKDILRAGMDLILDGYAGGGQGIKDFMSSLNRLRDKISRMLFTQGQTTSDIQADAASPAGDEETNLRIAGILGAIKAKWLDSEKTVPESEGPHKQVPADTAETFEETVVIPMKQAPKETRIIEEPEDFHETVILNAATLSGRKAKGPEKPEEKPAVNLDDVLEETVVMGVGARRTAALPASGGKTDADKRPATENMDDELSETVIIKK